MQVLKSSKKQYTTIPSWTKHSPNFLLPIPWFCERFSPIPIPTGGLLCWCRINSQLHPWCKATKPTWQGQKMRGLSIIWGTVGTQPRRCQVLFQLTSVRDVAQLFGGFQLVLLSFLGEISQFNSIFPGISWQSSPLQNHSPPSAAGLQQQCERSNGSFSKQQIWWNFIRIYVLVSHRSFWKLLQFKVKWIFPKYPPWGDTYTSALIQWNVLWEILT